MSSTFNIQLSWCDNIRADAADTNVSTTLYQRQYCCNWRIPCQHLQQMCNHRFYIQISVHKLDSAVLPVAHEVN